MKTPKIVKKTLSSAAYEVGYGKPPKPGQFKPGQSGNPKGRPKRQATTEELVLKEAARLIGIKMGDRVAHVTRREALVRKLFQTALEGDSRSTAMLLNILFRGELALAEAEVDAPGASPSDPATAPDEETLRRMLERFGHLLPPEKE